MLPTGDSRDRTSQQTGYLQTRLVGANPNLDAEGGLSELTEAVAAGEEQAFSVFYDRYYDRLFRYLIVMTQGDEPRTRDLLQVTLIKVVRAIKPFEEECRLWQWLKTIARNTFLDSIRQASRTPNLIPLFEIDAELRSMPNDGNDEWPLIEALDACLVDLPPFERDLVETCYFRNVSQQEAAAQRNTTAKAIESKLARLRQKLRVAILRRLRHENL